MRQPACAGGCRTLVKAAQQVAQHFLPALHVIVLELVIELLQQLAAADAIVNKLPVVGIVGLAWQGGGRGRVGTGRCGGGGRWRRRLAGAAAAEHSSACCQPIGNTCQQPLLVGQLYLKDRGPGASNVTIGNHAASALHLSGSYCSAI